MAKTCLLCQREFEEAFNLGAIWQFRPMKNQPICPSCQSQFKTITAPFCEQCHRPLKVSDEKLCYDCQRWQDQGWVNSHHAFVQYNAVFRTWLLQIKGQGDLRLTDYFAQDLQNWRKKHRHAIWLPLPSSQARFMDRGFHQTQAILKYSNLPYQDIFAPVMDQGKQAKRKRHERLLDLSPLTLKTNIQIDVVQSVIIFDDVYTTGATLYRAYQALVLAGFKDIQTLTLAR